MGDGTKENPYTRKDVLRLIKENGGNAKELNLSKKYFNEYIDLSDIPLREIILNEAHLNGANLGGADLTGANLEGAYLKGILISNDTKLDNVYWGNYKLGEEKEGENNESDERIRLFNLALPTYRLLKIWHTEHGITDVAGKFYYREKEVSRKVSKRKRDIVTGWLSWAVFGHGEGWKRLLFIWITGVILVLAIAYYFLGSFNSTSFLDTLYYSAVSFSALGYGSWAPEPTGWAKAMGAVEAIIGVFMMALLLVTLVRKWTR